MNVLWVFLGSFWVLLFILHVFINLPFDIFIDDASSKLRKICTVNLQNERKIIEHFNKINKMSQNVIHIIITMWEFISLDTQYAWKELVIRVFFSNRQLKTNKNCAINVECSICFDTSCFLWQHLAKQDFRYSEMSSNHQIFLIAKITSMCSDQSTTRIHYWSIEWWSIILIWAFTVFQSNLSDCGPFLSNLLLQAQLYDDKKCFSSSSSPFKKNPQTIDDDKWNKLSYYY